MALEQSLRQICSSLTSVRATERKKSAETLKDMLNRTAIPSLLSENTLKKSGYNWNHIFSDINDYIIRETEKFETSKNFAVIIGISTSLLNLCVSGSNKGGAYIKCDIIMEACLNIFNDNRLRKAVGDAYFSVLYKHVLSNDYYLGYITPSMWENLLEACITTCLSNASELDNLTKFKLLWMVIKNASNTTQFHGCLRDSLTDIKKCLLKVMYDNKVQEFVMKIILLLLEFLSTECRLLICEFSETVLPILFKFYDHSMDVKRKSLLFKVLQIAIALHHPLGKLQNEEGSMAHDWSIWRKHLHSLLEVVCLEINHTQKNLKQNNNSAMCCDNFSHLAAITYYQIFNESRSDTVETGEETSAKKPKLSFGKHKTFSDLLDELQHNPEPWIGIIHMYVKYFESSLTASDYLSILNISEVLISNASKCLNWDSLGKVSCLAIEYFIHGHNMANDKNDVFITLWNTCVRNSSVANVAHKTIHTIIWSLLRLDILKYSHVQPLLVFYFEKGMHANNDSLKTLVCVYCKFYSNCFHVEKRIKCLDWLMHLNITQIDIVPLKILLLRLMSNENILLDQDNSKSIVSNKLYDTLFKNVETSILFGSFDYEITIAKDNTKDLEEEFDVIEANKEMSALVMNYLQKKISEFSSNTTDSDASIEQGKYIHVVLHLFEALQKYKLFTRDNIVNSQLYFVLVSSLKNLFVLLTRSLMSDEQIRKKISFLKCLKGILEDDYGSFLNNVIRACIDENCFHAVNAVLKTEVDHENDENNYEEDIELSLVGLRHQCVYFLAAYCSQQHTYSDELVKCILDEDLYKFESHWDVECALRCITMVVNHDKNNRHLDVVFQLMKNMCKVLFRNSKASLGLLQILLKILDRIWAMNDSVIRKNCVIMVKGYFERCNKLYYPPHVAVLIYECAVRVLELNKKYEVELDDSFKDINLMSQLKGNNHNIRIYCCYLMKHLFVNIDEDDIKKISTSLMDIFLINVEPGKEIVLKDETINRTLTVLHCFFALSEIKPPLLLNIVFEIIHAQKKKSLSKRFTKKVLNIIVKNITHRSLDDYVNNNIKDILYYWFQENEKFEDIPLHLLGFKSVEIFLEKHLKWLVASEILWCCKGFIDKSETIKIVVSKSGKTTDDVIEMCFSSIITLCLPYIVIEMYNLEDEKYPNFKLLLENSNRMFQSTRQILKNEKWSNLFVEHMGDLILLAATHVCDPHSAKRDFELPQLSVKKNTYMYSKTVFKAVLRYFGELIDGNIMQYLCENQPLVILNILFKLWSNFVNENVFELKKLYLHTYVSFIENIPMGYQSDAVLFNFVFNTLANAIHESKMQQELRIIVQAFKFISEKVFKQPSNRLESLRKSIIAKVLSILSAKKEESSCSLANYLMDFKNSEDVVDNAGLVYKSKIGEHKCSSKAQFENMLETYITNLIYPSDIILSNLRQFLKTNYENVNSLCKDLNMKGFSEECQNSQVHRIINALNKILKTSNDDKIIIEACNCLAEMATYDIKTLVTVPPTDTEKVRTLSPKQYFVYFLLLTLESELFDEDPSVNSKVAKVINRILKYRDGKLALDMEGINKEILQPLSPSNSDIFAEYQIDETKLEAFSSVDFWIPKQREDHLRWIVRITTGLLNLITPGNNCIATLCAVCVVKPTISAKIMPPVLGLLFDSDARSKSEKLIQIVGEQINQFFNYIWEITFDDKLENSEDGTGTRISNKLDHSHKMIIQYILDLINFVRLQAKNYKIRKPLLLNYLNLDYNKVAWAGALADLNLVAIYYGELWAARQSGVPPASPDATCNLDGGAHLQRIFRGCFVSIGELDAVEGCGTAHLTSEEEKRKHLINTGQFTDSLLLHDIALSSGAQDRALQHGAVTSLHRAGMHHLALQYIKSCPESEQLNDIKYDCLSLLGDWSDFVDTRELEQKSKLTSYNMNSITRMFRYACLKDCLNIQPDEDFFAKFEKPLNGAKLAISRLCRNLNMENSQCVYKIMASLHLFRDIENYFAVRCGKEHISALINSWNVEKLPPYRDFKHLEALISQRSLILQHAAENYGVYSTEINSLQLQYAELGLSNHRVQMAQRVVAMVKNFQPSKEVTLLESKVSWEKGHKDIALSLLHDNVADESVNVKLTAMSLRQYGLWMAECKCENARDIINRYLEKSLNVLKDVDDVNTRLKVYYDIAQFADAEYKQVVSYMNSTTFENKVKCLESMKGTAACLKSTQQTLTKDEKKALMTNNAFRQLDEAEIANTRAEKESFLNLAMRYYLLSLKQSEENMLSVFRVISLWFENNTMDLSSEGLGGLLQAVPAWKFIAVLPQVAPRLCDEQTPFAQHLRNIIVRCAIEHPHHTLPILFNLKNSDKDKHFRGGGEGGAGGAESQPEPRVAAAGALVARLAARSPGLAAVVAQMERLCDAIIGFAYYDSTSKVIGKPLPIPREEPIFNLRDLDSVPVPTDTIAIRKNCDYSNLSSLSAFENFYELVGGINFPKKIYCRSSDGRKRILLVKGEDDLRQDAVMQQVFTIVNTLLENNPVTYHNKLIIRTYKVVAMSRRSGVLEWCAGTTPLGTYLAHAHTRYRPQDITPSEARNKLKECQENRRSNKHKLAVFNEILHVFKPVFHYFFTEHYLDPVTWYERRLAYTRSVATSSMVGYIMGIGDRHVQNILIDKTTAEVIHIDFGIAFDQGKTLPTPETVPFRLTQDIIAGFGCSGVEGIFRRSCEKTLQLLRDNQETLLTILEVLLCDPLYLWIVPTAAKDSSERHVESVAGGGLAERALLVVRSKVSGAEGGAGGVSVRGQVAALLHRATDRANLCRLYHGWQPYL